MTTRSVTAVSYTHLDVYKRQGYSVMSKPWNFGEERGTVQFSQIKEKIDSGIPLLIYPENHVVTIIGYQYDEEINYQGIIYYDSAFDSKMYFYSDWEDYSSLRIVTFQRM